MPWCRCAGSAMRPGSRSIGLRATCSACAARRPTRRRLACPRWRPERMAGSRPNDCLTGATAMAPLRRRSATTCRAPWTSAWTFWPARRPPSRGCMRSGSCCFMRTVWPSVLPWPRSGWVSARTTRCWTCPFHPLSGRSDRRSGCLPARWSWAHAFMGWCRPTNAGPTWYRFQMPRSTPRWCPGHAMPSSSRMVATTNPLGGPPKAGSG